MILANAESEAIIYSALLDGNNKENHGIFGIKLSVIMPIYNVSCRFQASTISPI